MRGYGGVFVRGFFFDFMNVVFGRKIGLFSLYRVGG